MIIQLENATYSVSIDSLGAELKSFDNRLDNTKYLFNGDPVWWNGTAPVLFPIIGGLSGGSYNFGGKSYQLGSHGFARKSEFSVREKTRDKAVFELRSDMKTYEQYPFNFILTITFNLEYAGISVRYEVKNTDKNTLYFSIGSHPAFNVPFAGGSLENYFIEFEQPETDSRFFFIDGCVSLEAEPVFSNSRHLFLTPYIFDRGPIILKNVASRVVGIRKSRSPHTIRMTFDAPNIAIWSKPNRAPFVCIEPWWGIPDPVGFSDSFDKKPGIIPLAPQEVFTTRYALEVQ
jgi:galactose mutarotase-like enzyme